jgi:hypothetical protein
MPGGLASAAGGGRAPDSVSVKRLVRRFIIQ